MTPNRYTELAAQASERYVEVLGVFRSILFQAQAQPFTTARADALRANAVEIGRAFLRTEADHIEEALRECALNAVRTAQSDVSVDPVSDIPPELEAFLEQSLSFLLTELSAQVQRDAESLVKRYREFAVEANLAQRSSGRNLRAAIAAVGNQASERIRFQFRDRGGRLYVSSKYVRTVWRQTLLNLSAEFYLLEAAARGASVLEVHHPDPKSSWAGYQIDLTDTASFLQIRDELFHPHSDATLKVIG